MRVIDLPADPMSDADWERLDAAFASADWRESPADVLDAIDEQLAAFGLEVVQVETGGDDYMWRIEKRQEAA